MPVSTSSMPIEAKLEYIEKSPVLIDREGDTAFVSVGLPFDQWAAGEIDDDGTMFLRQLEIDTDFRRHGIATRLLGALAYIAKTEELTTIHSNVTSPHTIRIFKKLFPEDAISFYDAIPGDGRVVLPIPVEEAISSLERFDALEDDKYAGGFDFVINLGQVSLSNLEKPLRPPHPLFLEAYELK